MKRNLTALVVLLGLSIGAALAGTENRWVHVRIQDGGDESVNVDLPLRMVVEMLPMVETDHFRGGSVRIDEREWDVADLRGVLDALRNTPDSEFIRIRDDDETFRVAKENGFLLLRAEENDAAEVVRIRVPMTAVEALLSGGGDQLDLVAAVEALGEHRGVDLVRVEDGESSIRIWIDAREHGR